MTRLSPFRIALAILSAALLALQLGPARAEDLDGTVILVATPQLQDPLFSATILIARPLEDGGYAGFILNKPMRLTLGDAFPDDEPSKKVQGPLFLGGPVSSNVLFALVKRVDSPGRGSVRMTEDLFLATTSETIDTIIRKEPDHARFFIGAVLWRPGQLQDELKRGVWYVLDADSDTALDKDTARLWERLVKRSEDRANAL
jgi:putative transcriptional regulator